MITQISCNAIIKIVGLSSYMRFGIKRKGKVLVECVINIKTANNFYLMALNRA